MAKASLQELLVAFGKRDAPGQAPPMPGNCSLRMLLGMPVAFGFCFTKHKGARPWLHLAHSRTGLSEHERHRIAAEAQG